jgi:hypothetical protein
MNAAAALPAAAPPTRPVETRAAAPYRQEGDATLIEVSLRRLPQLFNSLDPSPFHEKDLDPDADVYLVGAAREISARAPIKLVIHLPASELEWADTAHVGDAIHNYFSYRWRNARRDLRMIFRRGRISLAIGLLFLLVCMTLRELVVSLPPTTLARAVAEGLVILGWVAMWGPLQVFLYDWWPIAQTARVLQRLALAPVEVRRLEE